MNAKLSRENENNAHDNVNVTKSLVKVCQDSEEENTKKNAENTFFVGS